MESADKALPYNYLGVQALPPRKKGRDRRRLNKALNRTEEEDDTSAAVVEEPVTVIDDPFSPAVGRAAAGGVGMLECCNAQICTREDTGRREVQRHS